MRHRNGRKKIGRTSSHLEAMLSNLVTSFFKYERVTTTIIKAKAAASLAEKMITKAKDDTLHSRRIVVKTVKDKDVLKKLFEEIGPRYKEKNGGYTRILKVANTRRGDGASLAILDLIDGAVAKSIKEGVEVEKSTKKPKTATKKTEKKVVNETAEKKAEKGTSKKKVITVDKAEVKELKEQK